MLLSPEEDISFRRVEIYFSIPPATTFSRLRNGGDSEGVLVGVRKRMEEL